MGDETVLRDIDRAYQDRQRQGLSRWQERAADEAHWQAKVTAVAAFADLNGWRKAPAFFDLDRLGRGAPTRSHHWSDNNRDRKLLDHPIWFYSARRFVAAIGQPYPPAAGDLNQWHAHLKERGLVLHVPPDPLASIHFPGSCLFLVVTLPGMTVRWLPEQDGRLSDRWASLRREAASAAP